MPEYSLGPKVLGEKAFKQQQREEASKANIFGEKVLCTEKVPPRDPNKPNVPSAPIPGLEPEEPPALAVSIEQLQNDLLENPDQYDEYFEAEIKRAEGPRKGALKFLWEIEMEKDEPRPGVIDQIDMALNADKRKVEREAEAAKVKAEREKKAKGETPEEE